MNISLWLGKKGQSWGEAAALAPSPCWVGSESAEDFLFSAENLFFDFFFFCPSWFFHKPVNNPHVITKNGNSAVNLCLYLPTTKDWQHTALKMCGVQLGQTMSAKEMEVCLVPEVSLGFRWLCTYKRHLEVTRWKHSYLQGRWPCSVFTWSCHVSLQFRFRSTILSLMGYLEKYKPPGLQLWSGAYHHPRGGCSASIINPTCMGKIKIL